MKQAYLILAAALFLSSCTFKSKESKSLYRNVVFIISDDHTYSTLGAFGNEIIRTPNLDKLAKEGVRFTNAYCNSPICSASRQSILTGKYPHATGVNLLFTPFPDEGNTTIAEHLRDHHFKTALFGKTHYNSWIFAPLYRDQLPDHGFEILDESSSWKKYIQSGKARVVPDSIETYRPKKHGAERKYNWNLFKKPAPYYDEDGEGTFLAKQAIDFMKNNRENRFCLWLAFHEPHQPFAFPVEYRDKYQPEEMPLPTGTEEDDRWLPKIFANLTETEKRNLIASYYTSVEYMDKNTGLVLNAVKELGLDKNTLVVYIADNGYLLHDHKRFEKHTMWAQAVKCPMIIKGKSLPQNNVNHELVEYVDIVPTVLDALGIDPIKEVQGKSFLELAEGKTNIHRDDVFSEFLHDNKAMVANKQWKYIFTSGKHDLDLGYETGFGPSGIYHRLYDLTADPGETTNLAYKPEYADQVKKMQEVMLDRFMKTHPDATNVPQKFSLTGQLVWFCEPRDIGGEYGDFPLRVFEANH